MNPKTDEYVKHKHHWVIDPMRHAIPGCRVLWCPECNVRVWETVPDKATVQAPIPMPKPTPGGWVMFWLTAALLLGIAMLCCSCEGVEAPPTYRHDGLAELLRESEPTYELHQIISIPASGYYLANPGHEIAVYVCDPAYLHGDGWRGYLVLRGGLAVFLASGRSPAYYKAVASALQAELPHVRCLDAFVGPDAPESFLEALKGQP